MESKAIQNSSNPLETESIWKLMRKFAVPAIITGLVNSLYNIVDQIFIGQSIGTLGNAATNVAFPLVIILTAFGMMIGVGQRQISVSSWEPERRKKLPAMWGTVLYSRLSLAYCSWW